MYIWLRDALCIHLFVMFVRYCVVLSLVAVQLARGADPCQTPSGLPGDCKPITDCRPLLSHSIQPISRNSAAILRSHHCGFAGSTPKVCCPTDDVSGTSNLLPDSESCGYFTESKIVGGEKTTLDEYPWMALLEYKREDGSKYFDCGGALISKRYILTAAHCINSKLINIRLGEHDTATPNDCIKSKFGEDCAPPPINVGVEETIIHEAYKKKDTNQYNDIALVRLKKDVAFTDYIRPICLPNGSEELAKTYLGENLFVSGWGLTENDTISTIKLKVRVPMRERSYCESIYRRYNFNLVLNENQFCAGGERGKDSCRGDSGGPLMTVRKDKNKDNQWYAAGVVSFGPMPCGMEKWGGVYTRIANFNPWIASKLRP